jgi:hypothetical protein
LAVPYKGNTTCSSTKKIKYGISGSHTAGYEEFYLLGYDSDVFLWNIRRLSPDYMALYPRR